MFVQALRFPALRPRHAVLQVALAVLLATLAAPALAQESSSEPAAETAMPAGVPGVRDPFEATNRKIWAFNMGLDRAVFRPVAWTYDRVLPDPLQNGITNFINNLQEPWTFINAILQANGDAAFKSLGRFMINSTVGLVGFRDQAGAWGVERQEEDFGQTLGVWGMHGEPFIMIPGFGPSSPRDFTGLVVGFLGDPVDMVIEREFGQAADFGLLGLEIIDARARALGTLDVLLETSADPYAAVRAGYTQRRAFEVSNGVVSPVIPLDDEYFDEPTEPAAQ